MKIQRVFGVYVATQRNKKGGGWYATGKTRKMAISELFDRIANS